MSIDLSLTAANGYFAPTNHTSAAQWLALTDETRKTAALAQAAREILRYTKFNRFDDLLLLPGWSSNTYRPDYAVFEQALFLLQRGATVPDGSQSAPRWDTIDTHDAGDSAPQVSGICRAAMDWLSAGGPRVRLVRG